MFKDIRWSDIFKSGLNVAEKIFEGFAPSEPIDEGCGLCGAGEKNNGDVPKTFYSNLQKQSEQQ